MTKRDYNENVGTQHVGLVTKGDTMANKKVKVYTYKRVSTSMQVDGYSLDAQNDRMEKYAEFNDMVIAGSYSDEGKSGKNIAGRTDFQRMLNDIAAKKDIFYNGQTIEEIRWDKKYSRNMLFIKKDRRSAVRVYSSSLSGGYRGDRA